MSNKQQIASSHIPSSLERFELSFEYDRTIQDIKKHVRMRTMQ